MTDPDEELMERLRRIADEVDAPPELVEESARAAFLTRRLDAELAELVSDSDLTTSGVRGAGPRALAFELRDLTLELQLDEGPDGLAMRGLVIGMTGPVHVEVDTPGSSSSAETDESGWFSVADVPRGPVRVRLQLSDDVEVSTGWLQP
jgi:hypothetical protein